MSEAQTADSDADTATETDHTEATATIHLEGPATFERALGDGHSVTATHEDVRISGSIPVDQQMLFEIASPESSLSKKFILGNLLSHESIMSGYQASDVDSWEVEIRATVEDWKTLTADVKHQLPYRNGEDQAQLALEYLAKLANHDLLGDSGLMAILELSQDPDASIADSKRTEILDELRPDGH